MLHAAVWYDISEIKIDGFDTQPPPHSISTRYSYHQLLHKPIGDAIPDPGRIWGSHNTKTHQHTNHALATQLQAVQFELLNTAILQLSREGFRRTVIRASQVQTRQRVYP